MSVSCENIPQKIAGIGLRDVLSYLCNVSTSASVVLEMAASSTRVRWVLRTKRGSSHLISLSSKSNYKKH